MAAGEPGEDGQGEEGFPYRPSRAGVGTIESAGHAGRTGVAVKIPDGNDEIRAEIPLIVEIPSW
jgi:hypothetical protein